MLNTPEGLRLRQAAASLVLAAGAIGLHGAETDNPTLPVPEQTEVQYPDAQALSPDNLALIRGDRDVPPRASRSRRNTTTPTPHPKPLLKSLGSFESTCYNLRGTTASGKSVGYGRVAVDPRIIPLGTRLHIEGYGDAVAADTGGLINGRIIDIWKPTRAQCMEWGRRIVHVTELP